LTGEKD